jgi:hypothetical protein
MLPDMRTLVATIAPNYYGFEVLPSEVSHVGKAYRFSVMNWSTNKCISSYYPFTRRLKPSSFRKPSKSHAATWGIDTGSLGVRVSTGNTGCAGIVRRVGHDRFLTSPFRFIVHMPYNPTLCSAASLKTPAPNKKGKAIPVRGRGRP